MLSYILIGLLIGWIIHLEVRFNKAKEQVKSLSCSYDNYKNYSMDKMHALSMELDDCNNKIKALLNFMELSYRRPSCQHENGFSFRNSLLRKHETFIDIYSEMFDRERKCKK